MTIGYIYRIWCLDTDIKDEYIGSTTNIRQRRCKHKSACNNSNDKSHNFRVYQFIRSHGGWPNWRVDSVEEVVFENKHELKRREGVVIQARGATLNVQVAGRTPRESLKASNKRYYTTNREAINMRYECLCGSIYTHSNRSIHFKTAKHIKNYERGLYDYINSWSVNIYFLTVSWKNLIKMYFFW